MPQAPVGEHAEVPQMVEQRGAGRRRHWVGGRPPAGLGDARVGFALGNRSSAGSCGPPAWSLRESVIVCRGGNRTSSSGVPIDVLSRDYIAAVKAVSVRELNVYNVIQAPRPGWLGQAERDAPTVYLELRCTQVTCLR